MLSIRELAKKYSDHGFVVTRARDRFGWRYFISAPGKKRDEVNTFAQECLGRGRLSSIYCVDGTWTYRLL